MLDLKQSQECRWRGRGYCRWREENEQRHRDGKKETTGDLKVHSPGAREPAETGCGKSWVPGENLNMPAKAGEN